MLLYLAVWLWGNDIILDSLKKFFFSIKTISISFFQKKIQSL